MAANNCIERIRTAMQDATDEEVLKMAEEAQRVLDDRVGQSTDEIMASLDEFLMDETIAKKIEGRNKALNAVAKRNIEQFVDDWGDDYHLGVEALLVGVNDLRMGSRRSVLANQAQLQESYLAGITSDIEQLSDLHFDGFSNGVWDDDIARALWQIGNGDDFKGLAPEAVDLAKVINKWQEVSRIDANESGAFIKKMPGYITRQSHDMDKIRKAGFDQWRQDIEPRLDERTFTGVEDREAYLQSLWDALSSGVHLGNGISGESAALQGFRNVGRGMSKERSVHFKSADDWIGYNKKYGIGELRESVFSGLMMSAQNTGLMKVLGPNAEMNYQALIDGIKNKHRTDPKFGKFQQSISNGGSLDNFKSSVTGEMNIPGGRKMLGLIAGSVRAYNSLTMLGKAVFSSIADVPIGASEMRYQGQSFLQSHGGSLKNAGGALGDMGRSIINRKLTVKSKEHRRVLAELGISLDATTGLFTNRFDPSGDMPGRLNRGLNTFFRWNGLTVWTDSMRAGSMIGMAGRIGSYIGMQHGKLPKGIQDVMSLYGIGRDEWGLISKAGTKKVDGVDGQFITPDMVLDIPDADISNHLESINVKPTDYQIRKTKKDLSESLRMYYVDRSQYAVIEPDAKTRAIMLQGSQPGTVAGEMWRSIMQFKAFPVSIIQKVWGREARGRRDKWSAVGGMAEILMMSIFAGYAAMVAKDLSKNRTPRDVDDPKTWGAAFLQGGGAGIYGDFLFGDVKNRFGGSALATIAGPTASQFNTFMDMWGKAREGDPDVGKSLFRAAYTGAPAVASAWFPPASALNAGYSRAVLDNLIYYNVMESLSPGYKRRMERRLKKENDQEYLIK
jgi:hypothetical protein